MPLCEAELAAMAEAFHAPYPSIDKVIQNREITEDERIALFDNLHSYRGDRSDYVLRSTMTHVFTIKIVLSPGAHTTRDIVRGDVLIDNVGYGQYKGETTNCFKRNENDGRKCGLVVASDDLTFLIRISFETMVKFLKLIEK